MTKFRYCKFADGTIKDFEDIVKEMYLKSLNLTGKLFHGLKIKALLGSKRKKITMKRVLVLWGFGLNENSL